MLNISDLPFNQALDVVPDAMNLWKEEISCRTRTRLHSSMKVVAKCTIFCLKKFHSEGRRHYDLHCQLSAVSLQAAIAEDGSEKEPLKPTDRHTSNHKIKRLQNY